MKTMEQLLKEAAEFLFQVWREAIESGQAEDAAQMYAWETMRANYGWRGIGEQEEDVIREWFIEAMHGYHG